MKIILKTTFLALIILSSFTATKATTITWLGGNGAWGNAAQWDTGTVPGFGDDVIIPSGYCKIFNGNSESATSVEVQSAARLYIYNGGELEISGAVDNHGLHNMGRIYHYGYMSVSDITQTTSTATANAIKNEARIYTYASSYIKIKYIDDDAIINDAVNSYFRARGGISINYCGNAAIINYDRFFNSGTIDIEDCGIASGFLMANTDDFRNLAFGVINLDSDIYGGISNVSTSTSANFRNYGKINIEQVSVGINNEGLLQNNADATIDSKYNSTAMLFNRDGATIINNGKLTSMYSASGINNYGSIINHKSFYAFYSYGSGGIYNFSTGFIDNHDNIYLLGSSSVDIRNEGNINNRNGAHISINKTINSLAGSTLSNSGFFVSYGSGFHSINGVFNNNGVIDDNYGEIQGLITNNKVLVAPVTGPMQVGVPYSNVLDVGSLIDVNIVDWKIPKNGVSAGTYDEITNEFTPNANAVGISTIYIEIYDLVSGNGRNFSLELGSPVLPFTGSKKLASTRRGLSNENSNFQNISVRAFPNPTTGSIQLESDALIENTIQIQIFNNLGQLVQEERLINGSMTQSINFSNQLANGIYIVKILNEGKEMDFKRIQLYR